MGLLQAIIAANHRSTPNSPEAQQFFDRLLTPPTSAREALYNTLIDGLVADGVWVKLDQLCVAAADEATCLENLVQALPMPGRDQSSGAAVYTADAGWSAGAALKNVTTGFNPTTAISPHYVRNDAMAMVVIEGGSAQNNATFDTGTSGAIVQCTDLYPNWVGDGKTYFAINAAADTLINPGPADINGMMILQRTASNASALYHNGVLIGTSTAASIAPVNNKFFMRCSIGTTAAWAIGASLSAGEHTALYNRVTTYLAAI